MSWLSLVSVNNTEQSVTVSIRGVRYEYFLPLTGADAAWEMRKRYRSQSQLLAWLKKMSLRVEKLDG